jgi:hypothetical protein
MNKNNIIKLLSKIRPLFNYMVDDSATVIKDLMDIDISRHVVFPCDIIDLRSIFITNKICFSNPIVLFSYLFAEKYLKDYSIFIILDSGKIKDNNYCQGGMQLVFSEELDISELIIRIVVNEPAGHDSFKKVQELLKEFDMGVECFLSNSIPGLNFQEKLSFNNSKKKSSQKIFEEDPLRLLRALRFHSKYPNSTLDPSIIKSMFDPKIQESYAKKVSPSRAGSEIMKMLIGDDPVPALKILFESGLYKQVFKVPTMENINSDGIMMDQKTPYHKYSLLDHTLKVVSNLNKTMKDSGENDEIRGLLNLAAIFHDFGKMDKDVAKEHPNPRIPGHTRYVGHEIKSEEMAEEILKSINVPKDKRALVNTIIKTHMFPHEASKWEKGSKKKIWKNPGKFIEKMKIKGKGGIDDLWKYVFYHAQADAMSSNPESFSEKEYNRGKEWFEQYYKEPFVTYTREQGTLIDGNVIENLRQQIEQEKQVKIRKNIIKDTLDFIKGQQYTKNIDMSFINLPEGQEKEILSQQSILNATNKAKSWMLNMYNRYLEPSKGEQKMGNNWFKKNKISQIVNMPNIEDPEIKKGPKNMASKFKVGMMVRDRRNSLSQNQDYGKVDYINGNKMIITWNFNDKDKKRKETFDVVEDTEILSLIVSEI